MLLNLGGGAYEIEIFEILCSLPLRYLLISYGNKPPFSMDGESKLYFQMMVQ